MDGWRSHSHALLSTPLSLTLTPLLFSLLSLSLLCFNPTMSSKENQIPTNPLESPAACQTTKVAEGVVAVAAEGVVATPPLTMSAVPQKITRTYGRKQQSQHVTTTTAGTISTTTTATATSTSSITHHGDSKEAALSQSFLDTDTDGKKKKRSSSLSMQEFKNLFQRKPTADLAGNSLETCLDAGHQGKSHPGKKQKISSLPSFSSTSSLSSSLSVPPKRSVLQQMHLDLGQKNAVMKTVHCSECGMTYVRDRGEDEQSHRTHHAQALYGVDRKVSSALIPAQKHLTDLSPYTYSYRGGTWRRPRCLKSGNRSRRKWCTSPRDRRVCTGQRYRECQ